MQYNSGLCFLCVNLDVGLKFAFGPFLFALYSDAWLLLCDHFNYQFTSDPIA